MAISAICLSIVFFEPSCLAYRGDAGRTIPWVPPAADTQIVTGVILMSDDEDIFSVSSSRYST